MPFKSEKQRRWMWANDPEMAKEWEEKEKSKCDEMKKENTKISSSLLRKIIREELFYREFFKDVKKEKK